MKKTFLILSIFLFLTYSCKTQKAVADKPSKTVGNKTIALQNNQISAGDMPNLLSLFTDSIDALVAVQIKEDISTIDTVKGHFHDRIIFSRNLLPGSYSFTEYHALWKSQKNRMDAINIIRKSDEHGLVSDSYHYNIVKELNEKYESLSVKELSELDILLTDAIVLYAYHLIEGKINPEDLSYSWNFKHHQLPKYIVQILHQDLFEEQLDLALLSLEPQDEEYQKLKKQLEANRRIAEQGGWGTLLLKSTIHPGESDSLLPQIRQRLVIEHFLSIEDVSAGILYDKSTLVAMKHFQEQHGLHPDGVIGKHTVQILNEPIGEKQRKIICNLERRRWFKYPKNQAYIKVNIAAYKMQFIENGEVVYKSNVVIGKLQKQTPMFMNKLKYVVLNPTWTLPFSITSTETLRKLKKDPNYLEKHNMVLLTHSGSPVNSQGIDWHHYKEGQFPYTVRQSGGPGNALGRVKFLFPNKYAIYLHDTPSKYLFSKEKRAFSHGCVRLQNPLDFAEFLLKKEPNSNWDMEKIKEIIKSDKTKTIGLKHKYPILLMYQTAGITENGKIYYYEDIYNRDKKLYGLLMEK